MQRIAIVLAAGAAAALVSSVGCSNLTAPAGDDPRNLPQVADRGDVGRPPAQSARPAGSAPVPGSPRIMRPPVPMRP